MHIALNVNDLPDISQPRLSRLALLCAGALHVAFLWLVMQSSPVQQAARDVVNYLKPITPMTVPEVQPPKVNRVPSAIQPVARSPEAPPAPPAPDLPVPAPVVAPALLSKAVTPPLPVPQVVEPKMAEVRAVTPIRTPVTPRPEIEARFEKLDSVADAPQEVTPPLMVESLPLEVQRRDLEVPALALPKSRSETILPQLSPVAVLPESAPVLPAPAKVQPAPTPVSAETTSPMVPAAPAPTAPVATAAPPRPSAITPAPPVPSAAPAVAVGAAAGGAGLSAPSGQAAQAGTGKPLSTTLYPTMMGNQPRQRSLSEMANEQLNGGRAPRDKLAEGIAKAGVPDCISSTGNGGGGGLFALVTVPIAAATGKCLMPK